MHSKYTTSNDLYIKVLK